MVFTLCGCGVMKFFEKNNEKEEIASKTEENTQYEIATEIVLGTEVELSTEMATETEVTTEVSKEADDEGETNTDTKGNTEGNSKADKQQVNKEQSSSQEKQIEDEKTKNETKNESNNEGTKVESSKEETSKQETPKEEVSKEEPSKDKIVKEEVPKEETPKEEPVVSESESTQPALARGAYLVKGQDLSGASLRVGDGMYDITVTTVDNETVTLSELLQEKDMVMLNFWATWCSPCKKEFPYMSQAYNMYKEDVEIIALDIEAYDTQAVVEQFRTENNLPFKVGQCSTSWLYAFGSSSIPTSVIIDRYGTICAIEVGAIYSTSGFTSIFERYVGDDYQPAY